MSCSFRQVLCLCYIEGLTATSVSVSTNMEPPDAVRSAPIAMTETSFLFIVLFLASMKDLPCCRVPAQPSMAYQALLRTVSFLPPSSFTVGAATATATCWLLRLGMAKKKKNDTAALAPVHCLQR